MAESHDGMGRPGQFKDREDAILIQYSFALFDTAYRRFHIADAIGNRDAIKTIALEGQRLGISLNLGEFMAASGGFCLGDFDHFRTEI